jgi:hypothetical protein
MRRRVICSCANHYAGHKYNGLAENGQASGGRWGIRVRILLPHRHQFRQVGTQSPVRSTATAALGRHRVDRAHRSASRKLVNRATGGRGGPDSKVLTSAQSIKVVLILCPTIIPLLTVIATWPSHTANHITGLGGNPLKPDLAHDSRFGVVTSV